MKIFYGKASLLEKASLSCCSFVLLLFLYDQISGSLNLWPLIILMALIEVYLLYLCLFPEEYFFSEEELEIRNKLKRTTTIKYDSIFNIDADVNDVLLNITQSGNVKLYYKVENKKTTKVCRPKRAAAFVDILKQRCPEFSSNDEKGNRLKVFFYN